MRPYDTRDCETNQSTTTMNNENNIKAILNNAYDTAMAKASGKTVPSSCLRPAIAQQLDVIVNHSEDRKGVMTVVCTSLLYKLIYPSQDVRYHQADLPNGYSGRTFDSKYVTPFLRQHKFPSMAESGWLTRSLEQKSPYTKDYRGAIKPTELKTAFLQIFNEIEVGNSSPTMMLDYLLQKLIIQRDSFKIALAKPQNLLIKDVIQLLDSHFHLRYKAAGASRLPVLALYAIYECVFENDLKRYQGKKLLPLESHNSADTRSGRLGDIDIIDENGDAFEAVEVKFDISINRDIISIAKEKILPSKVERYYILSTENPLESDLSMINSEIDKLNNTHGCQLVVNGILPTIKYYLRLLVKPSDFIEHYVDLISEDRALTFEHKQKWNELVSNL